MYPYTNVSLLSRGLGLIKNIKWGALLDGTGKTLSVINQAIPVVYQIKPIVSNAKTIFKIANVMNTNVEDDNNNVNYKTINNNSPIFYL